MGIHYIIIGIVVAIILALQIASLCGTLKRMNLFSKIFGEKDAPYLYKLLINDERINGFEVENVSYRNPYFERINNSINNYVANNESIDFQLLKDTVDANCDSIEEDIHTQIPIPLYLGLAGTMFGIIFGVGYLWYSGDLDSLLAVTPGSNGQTKGIVVLLGGVAIAMFCSIIGLLFTTVCTYLFKGCKLSIEQRKSDLFTWLQQNLLPEVATDDLQAIGKISRSLQSFNTTFKQHSDAFARTLQSVQTIMTQQQGLAKTVSQMGQDATDMARANAVATQRLEKNAEKLDQFNDYLDSINGYVNEVHKFTEQFKEETLRLEALEEIRNFFMEERNNMKKRNNTMSARVGVFDDSFKKAMKDLQNSMANETKELQKLIGQRTIAFDEALKEQKTLFVNANNEVISGLREQFEQLPQAVTAINNLKELPKQMQRLLDDVNASNQKIVSELRRALPSVVIQGGSTSGNNLAASPIVQPVLPSWLKWLLAVAIIVIMMASIFSSYTTWQMSLRPNSTKVVASSQDSVVMVDSLQKDTVKK